MESFGKCMSQDLTLGLKAGRARSRRTRRRKDIHLEPSSKRRLEVPSCAGALASPSTRRGSSSPSAPSRRAWGEDCPLLSQRRKPLRLGRLHNLPLVGFRSHGGSGGGGRRCWWCWWRWGAGRCSLSALGRRGRGGGFRDWSSNRRTGELPLFPMLIKREGADVPPFRIKKPPTISPTTPHSTRAVRGGRGGYGERYGVTQAACARALFWAWPNSARHRVWPRPGGSCRCTRVGVP